MFLDSPGRVPQVCTVLTQTPSSSVVSLTRMQLSEIPTREFDKIEPVEYKCTKEYT